MGKRNRLRKSIVKASIYVAGILWLVSVTALDSINPIPMIVCGITTAYLLFICYCNK